jgi:hypothetical protein
MIDARSQINEELPRLLDQQKQILKSLGELKDILEFGMAHQRWGTQSLKIVQTLSPGRYEKFVGFYMANQNRKLLDDDIQDYIRLMGPAPNANPDEGRAAPAPKGGLMEPAPDADNGDELFDPQEMAKIQFLHKLQILGALSSRIDSVLADFEDHLFIELQEKELEAANALKAVSLRAAGALAGVILERHLEKVAANHAVTIEKKEMTIRDLNDPLNKSHAYDLSTWRKIQLLGDLRNLCSHHRSNAPTKEQVEDLITGVNSIIKSVF